MNAAKAKAAQRAQKLAALKGKGKAAETAAAALPAADVTPAPAAVARARPSVTQYWGDGVSAMTAPGGGILRIGYDQARFEQAINEVLIEPADLTVVAAEDKDKLAEPVVKVEVKKDDVAVVVQELELSTKEAEAALRKAGGDLVRALWELTAPQPVREFKQGPGGRPAIGVGAEL